MKRFLVFKGNNYYPCGGMDDFKGDYDSLKEAVFNVTQLLVVEGYEYTWGHIYDTELRQEVWEH